VAGCCEHDNEPSGSIKGGEVLDKESVPWSRLFFLLL
jgi:hypothetical protein